ncbi:MAG: chorismate mutase [Acholeplasmataceae bacterium]|nr:chorismate mutase [Acholeplasmataceae bacterium]
MEELISYREEIDVIDKQILALFSRRMAVVGKIAGYKMKKDMIVYDQTREDEVVNKNMDNCKDEELKPYYQEVLETILRVSKEYQKQIILRNTI